MVFLSSPVGGYMLSRRKWAAIRPLNLGARREALFILALVSATLTADERVRALRHQPAADDAGRHGSGCASRYSDRRRWLYSVRYSGFSSRQRRVASVAHSLHQHDRPRCRRRFERGRGALDAFDARTSVGCLSAPHASG